MPTQPQKFTKSKPEEKKTHQKSPSNYRKNPEHQQKQRQRESIFTSIRNEWKVITVSFLAGMLGMAIMFALFDVYQQLQILQSQEERKVALLQEVAMWEKIVASHPDYRDGYFKLALLHYQIGQRDQAQVNVEKALQIDPNYKKARNFAERLQ